MPHWKQKALHLKDCLWKDLYDAVNRIKETGSKVCGPSADVSGEMLAQDEIAERLKAEKSAGHHPEYTKC